MAENDNTGYSAQGVTTIIWGTTGAVGAIGNMGAGLAVVESMSQKQIVENIKLANGKGLTSTRVQLVDGISFNVTLRDDTRQTNPPMAGTLVYVRDNAGFTLSPGQLVTARVTEPDADYALKREGKRTFGLERLQLIEGQ